MHPLQITTHSHHPLEVGAPYRDREVVLSCPVEQCLDPGDVLCTLNGRQLVVDPFGPELLGEREQGGHALMGSAELGGHVALSEQLDVLRRYPDCREIHQNQYRFVYRV